MSRETKRKGGEEREDPVVISTIGHVTFLDSIGDPGFLPPADVIETPDALVIRMELSGVALEDAEVFVEGNTIVVMGEKRRDPSCAEASFLCVERTFGKFHRAFEMAGCLNMAQVAAVLREGVLVVAVPKLSERRGHRRRIPIATETKS